MAKRRKAGKKGGSLVVDFSKTDRSSRRVWVPDGEYLVEVDSVKDEIGQESGKPYLIWTLKIVEPEEYAGKKLRHTTSLQEHALWNLASTLEALGWEVPEGELNLSPLSQFKGLRMGVATETDTYQGKKRSEVADVFPEDELYEEAEDEEEDDEEEEEEPEDDEEEDEEDDEEEEDEEDDEEEEEDDDEEDEEDDEEEDEEDDEDEEEDEEEEEEEEEEPKPRRKGQRGSQKAPGGKKRGKR